MCWLLICAGIKGDHKSFKVHGISLAIDGSEDGDIYCLKLGEVNSMTAYFQSYKVGWSSDPFCDLNNDKKELETNLLADED